MKFSRINKYMCFFNLKHNYKYRNIKFNINLFLTNVFIHYLAIYLIIKLKINLVKLLIVKRHLDVLMYCNFFKYKIFLFSYITRSSIFVSVVIKF